MLEAGQSEWADAIVESRCQGKCSSIMLQDHAKRLVNDLGASAPQAIQSLASLGAFGKHAGNVHRDFMKMKIVDESGNDIKVFVPPMRYMKVPMKVTCRNY